jgi:hypothetical protein
MDGQPAVYLYIATLEVNVLICRDEGYGARNRPGQLKARPVSWSCASKPIMNDSRSLAA